MGFFPPLQFWQNRQKKVLGDILERINAFLDCKNKKQKNSKNCLYQRGYSMVLVKKWDFFPPFHFWQKRQEKSLWRYSTKKKHLSIIKKRSKQNRKIGLFPKGLVHGFWS